MRVAVKHTLTTFFVLSFFIFAGTVSAEEDTKKEKRPWIGVVIQPLTEELRKNKNIDAPKGIFVVHADEDGPAFDAGMRHGDVIINAGASSPATVADFISFIQSQSPDKMITFVVERDGKNVVIKIRPQLKDYPFTSPYKPDCKESYRLLKEQKPWPQYKD